MSADQFHVFSLYIFSWEKQAEPQTSKPAPLEKRPQEKHIFFLDGHLRRVFCALSPVAVILLSAFCWTCDEWIQVYYSPSHSIWSTCSFNIKQHITHEKNYSDVFKLNIIIHQMCSIIKVNHLCMKREALHYSASTYTLSYRGRHKSGQKNTFYISSFFNVSRCVIEQMKM